MMSNQFRRVSVERPRISTGDLRGTFNLIQNQTRGGQLVSSKTPRLSAALHPRAARYSSPFPIDELRNELSAERKFDFSQVSTRTRQSRTLSLGKSIFLRAQYPIADTSAYFLTRQCTPRESLRKRALSTPAIFLALKREQFINGETFCPARLFVAINSRDINCCFPHNSH